MFRRIVAAVGVLVNLLLLTAVLLWMHAPIAGACKVFVPLATQVERSGLIVAGHIDSIEQDKYSIELPASWASPKQKQDVKRTRWMHDATLVVTDVLKGQPEFLATDVSADGDTVRTVHLLLDGAIKRSDGLSEIISTDDHAREGDEGVWFLVPGSIEGTYRFSDRAPLDRVDDIRECTRTLANNYAGWTPGIARDSLTTLVVCGSNYNTFAQSIVQGDGSVILSGTYCGDFFLGGKKQFTSPDWDGFVACLDAHGNILWCRALGCGRNASFTVERGLGGTFLLVGDVYEACSVLGSAPLWTGAPTRVVLCMSRDARVLWSRALGPLENRRSPNGVEGLWISATKDRYRIAGSFRGEMTCGEKHIVSQSGSDWFTGALDRNGKVLELRAVCPPGDQRATQILWTDHRIIMTGTCGMKWREEQPRKQQDVYVSTLSTTGQPVWADTVGGRWPDSFRGAAVSPDGMVVVSMLLTGDDTTPYVYGDAVQDTKLIAGAQTVHLCAWSAKGERLWDADGWGDLIAFGSDGKIYCAGTYDERWKGGPTPMYLPPSAGDRDILIECYDRKGTRLWARRDGGLSAEYAMALHLLPDHRALLVGGYEGTTYLAGRTEKCQGWSSAFVLNVALPAEE